MKRKLTLTIDEELLPLIKQIASYKNTSLSELVEEGMQKVINEQGESFSKKWLGKFKISFNKGDKRFKYLSEKYL